MIKIVTVIGARPQIIKAAALSRAIRENFSSSIKEIIVHTGQHYDEKMSEVFFSELNIPKPEYNLNVGSSSHGKQTAEMIKGIEEILLREKADAIVLYGDTNSTLAGAVAASKIHVPVVHIEAGLRSFNKSMPEEVNRILCDHVSTLLFSPTPAGIKNLKDEGVVAREKQGKATADHPKVFHCGDVMYDNSLHFSEVAESRNTIISELDLKGKDFILLTVHRNNNTDEPSRLNSILEAMNDILVSSGKTIVFPVHPRTRKVLTESHSEILSKLSATNRFLITEPVSFLGMIALEKNCSMVITDSGGVQKEAFFFRKPCVILRPETEWVELLETGSAIIADAGREKIVSAFQKLDKGDGQNFPAIFGDGKASEFICKMIVENFT